MIGPLTGLELNRLSWLHREFQVSISLPPPLLELQVCASVPGFFFFLKIGAADRTQILMLVKQTLPPELPLSPGYSL